MRLSECAGDERVRNAVEGGVENLMGNKFIISSGGASGAAGHGDHGRAGEGVQR